jgi:amidase
VEFLGREWSESALLHLAYDWDRRRQRLAPTTTPPLVKRKPPQPTTWDERAEHFTGRFTFDRLTNELSYDAHVEGVKPEDVLLVALHRGTIDPRDVETRRGIIARLVEPGSLTGRGMVTLRYPFNAELARGELFVHVYTRTRSSNPTRLRLRMP